MRPPLGRFWLTGLQKRRAVCSHAHSIPGPVSDSNAIAYTAKHGIVGWHDIRTALDAGPACRRLRSYWHFEGCGYRKAKGTCSEPEHFPSCLLPQHPARKGSLIQAAYALHLFVRDICQDDFVGWINWRLAAGGCGPRPRST